MNADGVCRPHELTTTFLPKRSGVNGFTLRDDAKLNVFFQMAIKEIKKL